MLDQTFFKFVTGFALILAGSFILMYVTSVYFAEDTNIQVQQTAAQVISSQE